MTTKKAPAKAPAKAPPKAPEPPQPTPVDPLADFDPAQVARYRHALWQGVNVDGPFENLNAEQRQAIASS